jgi:hypothetical protein
MTLRADPWLARLGFMGVLHIEEVTQELITQGLHFGDDMMGGDEMDGPVRSCPWLGWGPLMWRGRERPAAWMIVDGTPRWPRRMGGRV